MISIELYNDSIKVTGHGKNESCARASTIFDVFTAVLKEPKEIERQNGFSYVKYDLEGKTKQETKENNKLFELFCKFYISLNELYPGMTRVKDYRKKDDKKEKENAD